MTSRPARSSLTIAGSSASVGAGPSTAPDPDGAPPLPADDPALGAPDLDLDALAARWANGLTRPPMSAEEMRGADVRAQRQGVAGGQLMSQAGAAVAAATWALLGTTERRGHGRLLILVGPGNNGGDGSVAARLLAQRGLSSVVVLVGTAPRPETRDAARAWDRLDDQPLVQRLHASSPREVNILLNGIERAAVIVDALLGTGVRGPLREPVRSAVDLIRRAREGGVPVLAVDTPTALDLTSGEPSDPVVRADLTVTFHRPKLGLLTRSGRALAGRVLVAPIGIPALADPS
ncbi:MAG: NAD(P)H-hydrate epimerase [Candidatus Limnocylindrales bacterium]